MNYSKLFDDGIIITISNLENGKNILDIIQSYDVKIDIDVNGSITYFKKGYLFIQTNFLTYSQDDAKYMKYYIQISDIEFLRTFKINKNVFRGGYD